MCAIHAVQKQFYVTINKIRVKIQGSHRIEKTGSRC